MPPDLVTVGPPPSPPPLAHSSAPRIPPGQSTPFAPARSAPPARPALPVSPQPVLPAPAATLVPPGHAVPAPLPALPLPSRPAALPTPAASLVSPAIAMTAALAALPAPMVSPKPAAPPAPVVPLALRVLSVPPALPARPAVPVRSVRAVRAVLSVLVTVVVVGLALCPPAAARRGVYVWPLAPPHPVLRAFSAPMTTYGPGHRGVDLGGTAGEAVLAAGDGTVLFAGEVGGRPVVSVVHGDGLRTTYEPVEPGVRAGVSVRRGEAVGVLLAGHPGCPQAACLHWGARRGLEYVNPIRLVSPGRVRLLPLPPAATGSG